MRYLLLVIFLAFTTFLATSAFADHRYDRNGYNDYASYDERIDRHLDRKGDMIQHRFEHKAMRAEAKGKYHKADRMRAKGERINRHLDRKGNRIHARHDNIYYQPRHQIRVRHHYYPKTRVLYRNHDRHSSYFGLVFNQPGLSIGWGWHE